MKVLATTLGVEGQHAGVVPIRLKPAGVAAPALPTAWVAELLRALA